MSKPRPPSKPTQPKPQVRYDGGATVASMGVLSLALAPVLVWLLLILGAR